MKYLSSEMRSLFLRDEVLSSGWYHQFLPALASRESLFICLQGMPLLPGLVARAKMVCLRGSAGNNEMLLRHIRSINVCNASTNFFDVLLVPSPLSACPVKPIHV